MINKNQLFESMRGIDDEILARSETNPATRRRLWKSSITAAACICLIIAAAALAPTLFPGKSPAPPVADVTPPQSTPGVPDENENVSEPQRTWTVNYNDVTTVLDAERLSIPGYFTEELNELELAAVEPGRKIEWMNYSGNAGFDGEGSLVAVYLRVTTPLPDTVVSVTISETAQVRDHILTDEPVISQCGGVEYTIYQYDMGSAGVLLEADAKINGRFFSFGMTAAGNDPDSLEQAKEAFRQVLECFTYYPEDGPELSAVTAEAIPEWFDRKLSQGEALDDPDFGTYMLNTIPAGFTEESIRRYKDQNFDYLSGLWTRGYDSLHWEVSYFSDTDAARLTGVEDTHNYDLSLYPIPWADSVPEELWAIVNDPIFDADELTLDAVYARAYKINDAGDTDGWRMDFSVKYGNILVYVSTKGVTPEWVYEQLISIRNP